MNEEERKLLESMLIEKFGMECVFGATINESYMHSEIDDYLRQHPELIVTIERREDGWHYCGFYARKIEQKKFTEKFK